MYQLYRVFLLFGDIPYTVDAGYKNTGYKNTGYKNTGYKNISVIRTIVCDPFLSFPIERVPVIRTFFSTPDSVLITGIY